MLNSVGLVMEPYGTPIFVFIFIPSIWIDVLFSKLAVYAMRSI